MKNDDMSDDEFDAFLNGKDDLSRRLQALPQPASSAQLDAAILQRIELALAQEQRPEAANDAGEATPAPRVRSGLGMRWRVPAGIAATLLAGVFAHQVFDASGDGKTSAMVSTPADMAAPAAAPVPAPAAEVSPPPPPASQPPPVAADAAANVVMAPAKPAQAERAKKQSAPAKPMPEPKVMRDAPAALGAAASIPAPAVAAPAPPPPPAPAPVASLPAPAPVLSLEERTLSRRAAPVTTTTANASNVRPREQDGSANAGGQLSKATAERSEPVTVAGARIKSDAAVAPAEDWLRVIDSLLQAQLKNDAKTEWQRFRKAYPDYPVSDEFKARIDALP